MLQRPSLSRSAETPLAGGDGATPPPVASSAAARSPRAAATPSERRLKDERPIFTPAITPEAWAREPYDDPDAARGATFLAIGTLSTIGFGLALAAAWTLLRIGGIL